MIQKKKILILGMARSGISVAKLLSQYHNDITITDLKKQDKKIIEEFQKLGIKTIITDHQENILDDSFDLVVKNPAIKKDNPTVAKAKILSIPVINEMEASYSFLPKNVQIIGITGSNGKTTTTTMIYELLKYKYPNVHLAGNIGIPLSDIVSSIKSNDIVVLEISDHQLCDMYQFKTNISIMTNLSHVHLDFHGSYENYKKIKAKIFQNHQKDDIAILNKDNKDVLEVSKDILSHKIYFSSHDKADIYLKENTIIYQGEKIVHCDDIQVKGIHNYENIMCAIIIAKKYGITNEEIKDFLQKFKGVEHRIEFVRTLHNRKFYNDSKSTNNQSTIIALSSFQEPTILLMGGLDRNIPFDEIAPALKNVKHIFSYGQTKNKIEDFAKKNHIPVTVTNTLQEAVKKAYRISEEKDVILLSPACASWDQYKDFETRGEEFKSIVMNLQ